MQTDLFNPSETVTRGKHYIEPRGYHGHPGSGPAGKTCGACQYCVKVRIYSRATPKCKQFRALWTRSRRSDILLKTPACQHFEQASETREIIWWH